MSSLIIARSIRRAIEEGTEEALRNPSPQPENPKVQKSVMTICSFIFFLLALFIAVVGLFTGLLPITLFAISVGIGSVTMAVLSLRDL